MEHRSAAFNGTGGIDCEINHPQHGWIPFTARGDDPEKFGRDLYAELEPAAAPYEPRPPAPITPEQVNAERDRRILAGTTFSVTGYGDVPLTGRTFDIQVYEAQRARAREAQAAGITDPIFVLRDATNTNHLLTADQVVELVDKAGAWLQATMAVAWAMKDGDAPFEAGTPADFDDGGYWPAGS